ncbi:hypothetical protein BH23PLA1_BH23PLA1_15850 [soil metagenome]
MSDDEECASCRSWASDIFDAPDVVWHTTNKKGYEQEAKMGVDDEWQVLMSQEGRTLLAEVAAVPRPGPADLDRWRQGTTTGMVSAAVRLAEARRRGSAKFERAGKMWLDPTGLEQATAEPVARHKATRFDGAGVVVDLCSGIGGDAIALAGVARRVLAVDADHAMGRRARFNALAYGVGERVLPIQARAERFPIPTGALIQIDPDRRTGARRARSLNDYVPGPAVLAGLAQSAPGGAIKLGPASDFEAHFGGPGFEIELVSLDGECKDATVWFGSLTTCRRRASVLTSRGLSESWTDRDGPTGTRAPVVPLGGLIFDPDPALGRAGLLDGFAVAQGLGRVAAGVDFLAGEPRLASRFLTTFEVVEVLSMDIKRLRRRIAERGLGPLEIKPKGLDIRPEELRSRLRPPGPEPASLLLIGGDGPARAVLARRCP